MVGILCLFFVMPEEAGIHASESVSITLINRYSMEQALLVATVDVGRPRSLSDYAECYCAAGRAANVFVAGKGTSEGAAVSVNHPGYGKNVEKQGSVVNN